MPAFQVNEAGYPARAVMAAFQKNPQILMTHAGNGIESIEDMRGKPVTIGASSRTTFWPFLRAKFGVADNQIRSYTGQLGPYLVDLAAIRDHRDRGHQPARHRRDDRRALETAFRAARRSGLIGNDQDYSRAFTLQFVNKRFPAAPR
jgi:NMT1/THI5 like